MSLVEIATQLQRELAPLRFGPPTTHVYDPTTYAWAMHAAYLTRFGAGPKEVVLVGMNPGPWGMAQTGVPFGEVAAVRDWLGLSAPIGRPPVENASRPIVGLACTRSEVSGQRLWGWARALAGTPERFFARAFVLNYCPLVFMEESGKNRTPDKLVASEREPLLAACDRALASAVRVLAPRVVIGVGAWAEERARAALAGQAVEIGRMLHPSPASPLANQGWSGQATEALARYGVRFD